MNNKYIAGILCALIVTGTVLFCGCEDTNNDKNAATLDLAYDEFNDFAGKNGIDDIDNNINLGGLEDNDTINKTFVYDKSKTIEKNGLRYSNFSFYKGKTLPESVKKNEFEYFNECKIDENGKILDDKSYLFITMDVTNNDDKTRNLCWYLSINLLEDNDDSYKISPFDESNPSGEVRYRSGKRDFEDEKMDYVSVIKPGETLNITSGFLMSDSNVNSDMLCFAPESCDVSNAIVWDKAKCIWINK